MTMTSGDVVDWLRTSGNGEVCVTRSSLVALFDVWLADNGLSLDGIMGMPLSELEWASDRIDGIIDDPVAIAPSSLAYALADAGDRSQVLVLFMKRKLAI